MSAAGVHDRRCCPAPLVWAAVVDLGASWIQGLDGNPMTELAKQAGVALYPTFVNGTKQVRRAALCPA